MSDCSARSMICHCRRRPRKRQYKCNIYTDALSLHLQVTIFPLFLARQHELHLCRGHLSASKSDEYQSLSPLVDCTLEFLGRNSTLIMTATNGSGNYDQKLFADCIDFYKILRQPIESEKNCRIKRYKAKD